MVPVNESDPVWAKLVAETAEAFERVVAQRKVVVVDIELLRVKIHGDGVRGFRALGEIAGDVRGWSARSRVARAAEDRRIADGDGRLGAPAQRDEELHRHFVLWGAINYQIRRVHVVEVLSVTEIMAHQAGAIVAHRNAETVGVSAATVHGAAAPSALFPTAAARGAAAGGDVLRFWEGCDGCGVAGRRAAGERGDRRKRQ